MKHDNGVNNLSKVNHGCQYSSETGVRTLTMSM